MAADGVVCSHPAALYVLGHLLFAGTLPVGTAGLLGNKLLSMGATCCDRGGCAATAAPFVWLWRGGRCGFAGLQYVSVRAPLLVLCLCGHAAECVGGLSVLAAVGRAVLEVWCGRTG